VYMHATPDLQLRAIDMALQGTFRGAMMPQSGRKQPCAPGAIFSPYQRLENAAIFAYIVGVAKADAACPWWTGPMA